MSVDGKSWSCESRSGGQDRCRHRTRRRGTRAPAGRVGRPTTNMGQKRRKCLEFVAAPQPARAARTHRARVRHTLWTPPSVPNQLECKSSTPRSLWGCNKLAAERATEGVTNCVYGPRAVSGVSNMRGFDSYRLLTLSLAALMTRISSAMIEGAHTSAGAATLARTVPFWGRFRSPREPTAGLCRGCLLPSATNTAPSRHHLQAVLCDGWDVQSKRHQLGSCDLKPASCMGGPDVDRRPMTTVKLRWNESTSLV